jgi:uncharacterized protein
MSYWKNEFHKLLKEVKSLDFKTVYIFISVAFILFISFTLTNASFYLKNIGKDFLDSRLYWLFGDGVMMFLLSVISIKLVFKEKLSSFGFTFGEKKFGFGTTIIFFAVMLPIVWIVSASETFSRTYPQGGPSLKENMQLLFLYELGVFVYMLGWEFLWRGYMLFGLKVKLGYYAVFIQMIPFFILHRGKPDLELFGSILAGIILGVQALRSGSFIYAWLLHFLVMFSIDIISVVRNQLNFYKIL